MDDVADLRARLASPARVAELLRLDCDQAERARRRSRRSTRVMVLCPGHGERTASCSLTVGRDGTLRVHCFGGCGLDGDVFALLSAVTGVTAFPQLLDEARALCGVSRFVPVRARPPAPPPPAPSEPEPLSDEAFAALLEPLLKGARPSRQPDVVAYLTRRLLASEAEADGWAALPPAPEQGRWLARLREQHGDDVVGRSGLVPLDEETDEPLFHRFVQPGARLVIPWRHLDGTLATIQRRRLDGGGEGRPRYVAARGRPPRTLYGAERLAQTRSEARPLCIVEGAVDVLARRVLTRLAGLPPEDVVGLPGTGAWRADLLPPALFRLPGGAGARLVHVATDANEAGDRCAAAIAADVAQLGGVPVRKRPAVGEDWGDVLCALAGSSTMLTDDGRASRGGERGRAA